MNKTTEISSAEIAAFMRGYIESGAGAVAAAKSARAYYAYTATAPTVADCLKAWDNSKKGA